MSVENLVENIEAMTILVIEDNCDDAEILESKLLQIERKHITFLIQQTLGSGLKRLAEGGIDIIFLDLSLPDSSGLDALTKIRKISPLIPIIVLTGLNDYNLSLKSLRMGAQDYLLKNEITVSALERSIDYACVRQHGYEVAQFLTSLVQSSVDAIIGRSIEGNIVSWNGGAEEMYGYTDAEIRNQSFDKLIPRNRADEINHLLEKAESGSSIANYESFGQRKNGTTIPISCSISPLKNFEGLATGAVIVARDISGKLQAQKDLRESNQRLQLAVLAAKVGVWSWDTQLGTIIWDDLMCAFFGRPRVDNPRQGAELFDLTIENFMDIVYPGDRTKVLDALTNVLEHNCNYECKYRIIWPDSSLHFIEASGVLTFDEDGRRSKMIGVCMDVTERKTMEKNLSAINRRREQIASAIVQNAPVGIVTVDSNLTITDVNKTFAVMLGKHPKELLLKTLGAVMPDEIFQKAQKSIKSGSSFQLFRVKFEVPTPSSQKSHYLDLSFWPVLSRHGEITGAILQAADCTDVVMLEEQREDFVAAVAHDIKNPLIGAGRILNFLCGQSDSNPAQNNQEILTVLRDSNLRLLGLVQNLVDIHRFETMGYPVDRVDINLHDVVADCINQNKLFCDSREISVQLKVKSAPVTISADEVGLSRVLINLLHNAIKFSHVGGNVEVVIDEIASEMVEIAIIDNGVGISDSDKQKLFQRYGQGDAGKRMADSSGLGLYISRQIVEAHGGQIGCVSQLGMGSTFFIRLPINPDAQVC